MPVGEVVEAFAGLTLPEIATQHPFNTLRHLFRRDGTANLASDRELRPTATADDDVIALDLFVLTLFNLCRKQADIADIVLGTGVWAARQVDVDRLIQC